VRSRSDWSVGLLLRCANVKPSPARSQCLSSCCESVTDRPTDRLAHVTNGPVTGNRRQTNMNTTSAAHGEHALPPYRSVQFHPNT
jgi:hypothetical protein